MTTYNTGNPVPSADARDRYDNSQTLDEVVNGDSESYTSRTGKQIISLGGMNSRFNNAQDGRAQDFTESQIDRSTAFDFAQSERTVAFLEFLEGSGWSSLGAYGAGVVITSHTQTVDYLGQPYSLKPSIPASLDAPYTTSGNWSTEGINFKLVGDNSLRQDLFDPAGTTLVRFQQSYTDSVVRTASAKLKEIRVSPEDFGAVGDGVADDTAPWLKAVMTGNMQGKPGAIYRLVITADAMTAQPPAGSVIDFNGSMITHEVNDRLVILFRDSRGSILNRFKGSFKSTYPANTGAVTRYGLTYTSAAGFCGFVGMTGDNRDLKISCTNTFGATDANLYDTVIRGFTGNTTGAAITGVYCTHYSNALSDGLHGTVISAIFGTKRHNESFAHYGPSHLMYAGINNGSLRDVFEFGTLVSNLSGAAEATVQLIGYDNASIENIRCTMADVGVMSLKVAGNGATIRKVVSNSPATVSRYMRLFEIQTNLSATVLKTLIEDVLIVLPAGNPAAVGFRAGGGYTQTRNVRVVSKFADTPRTAEVVQIVTSERGEFEVSIESGRTDDKVLLAGANFSEIKLYAENSGLVLVDGTSMAGEVWGPCANSTIYADGTLLSEWTNNLSAVTRNSSLLQFSDAVQGDFYRQLINQSSNTTLQVDVPVLTPATTSVTHNMMVYEVDVMVSSIQGQGARHTRYSLILHLGTSGSGATAKEMVTNPSGATPPVITATVDGSMTTLSLVATRQAGAENLRDMVVRARRINSKPHRVS
ncbi:MAG: hypothetical protein [Bacteriophage sp.]|nr:MAG: hypothetical protein [Bacteriophage sp.]